MSERLRHNTGVSVWLCVCLCATLLLAHYPMLLSGLALMPENPGDLRLCHYSLEHSYLWLAGAEHHEHFWNPPFCYPHPNVAAYSDLMVGQGWLYWPWRMAGMAPDTAFQWWVLAAAAANFLAAYFFLRGIFRVRAFSAGIAAVVFASAGSLMAHIGHPQLYCQVYVLGAIAAVIGMFSPPATGAGRNARPRQWRNAALFCACLVLQLYTGFYLAFFVLLALGMALAYSLARREIRGWVVEVLRANILPISVCGGLSALVMVPWLMHYLAAMGEMGGRSLEEVRTQIPRLQTWFYTGPANWVYGWTAGWGLFRALPMEHEHRLGLGLVTMAACGTVLWLQRRLPVVRVIVATTLLLLLLATQFIPGLPAAWELVYWIVPGGKAIRSVSRIGMLLTIPAAIGLAFFLDHLLDRKKAVFLGLAGVIGMACILEQFTLKPSYDKAAMREEVAKIAREVRPGCRAFFYAERQPGVIWWQTQLSAMWAGLAAGKPTVNGYSSSYPPGWDLRDAISHSAYWFKNNREALRLWREQNRLDRQDIQWIGWQKPPPVPPLSLNVERKLCEPPGIDMLGGGWSYPEREGVWTDGEQAELTFSIPPEITAGSRYRLVLKFHAFAPMPQKEFRYTLSLNGGPASEHRAPSGQVRGVTLEVSGAQLKPVNLLRFRLYTVGSPKEVSESTDDRRLGIFLSTIELESVKREP
ncbi:MAG: hypothetical protein WA117_02590 [Verrucomicrobiia bacterium]